MDQGGLLRLHFVVNKPMQEQQTAVGRYRRWNERFNQAAMRQQLWSGLAGAGPSLVLGVMLGTTGTVETTMQEVAQVAGFGNGTSDGAQLALGDDALGQIDEDLL